MMVKACVAIQAAAHAPGLVVNAAGEREMEVCLVIVAGPAIDRAFAGTVANADVLTIAWRGRGGAALAAFRVRSTAFFLACLALGDVLCAAGSVAALSPAVVPDLEMEWVGVVIRLQRVAISVH